jgi:predicted nucleic acid-binding protein
MTDIFTDANILLYYSFQNSPHFQASHYFLRSLSKNAITGYITPYVLNEIHYNLIKNLDHQSAEDQIKIILKLPNINLVDLSLSVQDINAITNLSTKYRLKTFDAFHAYTCKKLKLKYIATFDPDFDRLPFLKRYQPNS